MSDDPRRVTEAHGSISPRQLKAVWALARRLHMASDDLHRLVESVSGKGSIRLLSQEDATRIIRELMVKGGEGVSGLRETPGKEGKATRSQMMFIEGLGRQLDWNQERLLRLARRMYGVWRLQDLKRGEASGLIEALKAIKIRHAA